MNRVIRCPVSAGRIFAEQGFDGATIEQITDAAKANVAAVNYHFGSKRNLYLEALRLPLPDIRGPLFQTVPGSSPKEELRSFINNLFSSMLGEGRPRWHSELAAREIVSPTDALPKLVEENFAPQDSQSGKQCSQILRFRARRRTAATSDAEHLGAVRFLVHIPQVPARTPAVGAWSNDDALLRRNQGMVTGDHSSSES